MSPLWSTVLFLLEYALHNMELEVSSAHLLQCFERQLSEASASASASSSLSSSSSTSSAGGLAQHNVLTTNCLSDTQRRDSFFEYLDADTATSLYHRIVRTLQWRQKVKKKKGQIIFLFRGERKVVESDCDGALRKKI